MTFPTFLIAMAAFALLGAAGHVLRGLINFFPDRLSDKPIMDMVISDGYSFWDHILQVEYDDFGFYRLDSQRNLVVSVALGMLSGFFMIALDAGTSHAVSTMIHAALGHAWDLIKLRFTELGLM